MLGWVLGFMAYDTIRTVNDKAKEKQREKEIKDIQFRLRKPMTRGHFKQCKCRLCQNRKADLNDKLTVLLSK
jgi:hypothetical protein